MRPSGGACGSVGSHYLHTCSPMGVYGRVSSHTISEPGHNGRVVYVYAGPHTNFEALHVE